MKRSLRIINRSDIFKSNVTSRSFATTLVRSQLPAEHEPPPPPTVSAEPRINRQPAKEPISFENRIQPSESPQLRRRPFGRNARIRAPAESSPATSPSTAVEEVGIFVDGTPQKFSAFLLRDICECPACVDVSTKQKLFSSADIPLDIRARATAQTDGGTSILWDGDVPGYPRNHTTEISSEVLRSLTATGFAEVPYAPREQVLWDSAMFEPIRDFDYDEYMQDDAVLYKALQQLHSHGLLFVTNVPESEKSVSTLGERIGPIKNTFYGYTWDVRSVPEAINVAYTSQDLGFHMDLLYMHQPPHLQLLHCIRSSAQGGASLFTDSYRAAQELFQSDVSAFTTLSQLEATFHYNHPLTNLYRQQRPVFEMKPLRNGMTTHKNAAKLAKFWDDKLSGGVKGINITEYIEDVNWSPPFQGPLALKMPYNSQDPNKKSALELLNTRVNGWHGAASKYGKLLHRPEGIYERLMRPGECVIFDNRRVLHARKAFEVGDAGTERWLRGAYLDKDPYVSKLRVLQKKFGDPAMMVDPVLETAEAM